MKVTKAAPKDAKDKRNGFKPKAEVGGLCRLFWSSPYTHIIILGNHDQADLCFVIRQGLLSNSSLVPRGHYEGD